MAILQSTDFSSGEYKIAQNCFTILDDYIEKYEQYYLVRLMGADLYDLFIADLTLTTPQVPQTGIYLTIFDPFNTDDDGCLRISEGILEMLKQLIYFHVMRDAPNTKTTVGVVNLQNENSTSGKVKGFNLVQSYNEGVDNYKEIQWYICDNPLDYPDYNGVALNWISGI